MKIEDEIIEALKLGNVELSKDLLPKFITNYKTEGGVNAKLSCGPFASYTLATCVAQYASTPAHLEILKLLAFYRADLALPDGNGHTPIYKASVYGKRLAVMLLVEHLNVPFDDPQTCDGRFWPTPLIGVLINIENCNNKYLKIELRNIAIYLLSKGANLNKTIYDDMTQIGFLVVIGDLNILKELDLLCNDLNIPISIYYSSLKWGHNLFTIAAFNKNWPVVEWLLTSQNFNPMAIPIRGKFANVPSFISIIEFADFTCDEFFRFLMLIIRNNMTFVTLAINPAWIMNDMVTPQYNKGWVPVIKYFVDFAKSKFNVDFINFINYLKNAGIKDNANKNAYYSFFLKYVLFLIGDDKYNAAIKYLSEFVFINDELHDYKNKYYICHILLLILNKSEHFKKNHNLPALRQIVSILENGLRKYGTLQDLLLYTVSNSVIDLSMPNRVLLSTTVLNGLISLLHEKQLSHTASYKGLTARFFRNYEKIEKVPRNEENMLNKNECKRACIENHNNKR